MHCRLKPLKVQALYVLQIFGWMGAVMISRVGVLLLKEEVYDSKQHHAECKQTCQSFSS